DPAVARQDGQDPRARAAALAGLGADVDLKLEIRLEPAIAARLVHPVEAGVVEVAVGLVENAPRRLGLRRTLAERRNHLARAADQLFAGQVRGSRYGHGSHP